jgi:AcrR family transcriptional regulator
MLDDLGDVELLSLRGLAAEVGIAAPSIYRHFPDKASLLIAVVERGFQEFDDALAAARDSGGADPFDRLRAAGLAYQRFGRERPAQYRILFSGAGMPPEVEPPEFMAESGRRCFGNLVAMIEDCLATGPGGKGLDAYPIAVEIWCMQHGLVDLPITNHTFAWPDPMAVTAAWLDRFRQTVMGPGSRPGRSPRRRA